MENKTNINIAELLKDAPQGTTLWSPLFGECTLGSVGDSITVFPTERVGGCEFTPYGQYFDVPGAECLLFPSRDRRTWEGFRAPWPHKSFAPFQRVLVAYRRQYLSGDGSWTAALYSHYSNGRHVTTDHAGWKDEDIIPYLGNEDKLGKEVG